MKSARWSFGLIPLSRQNSYWTNEIKQVSFQDRLGCQTKNHLSVCYFNTATPEQAAFQSDVSGAATVTPYPAQSIFSPPSIDRHWRVPLVSLARFLTKSSLEFLTACMARECECFLASSSLLFCLLLATQGQLITCVKPSKERHWSWNHSINTCLFYQACKVHDNGVFS